MKTYIHCMFFSLFYKFTIVTPVSIWHQSLKQTERFFCEQNVNRGRRGSRNNSSILLKIRNLCTLVPFLICYYITAFCLVSGIKNRQRRVWRQDYHYTGTWIAAIAFADKNSLSLHQKLSIVPFNYCWINHFQEPHR